MPSKLIHPLHRKHIEALSESVPMYLTQGWTEVTAPTSHTPKTRTRKTPVTTQAKGK